MATITMDSFGSDRHLRLVADSPIPSVISDPRRPDNPIVACNPPFCALTGYPPEEVIGRNCRFLAGPATEPWGVRRFFIRDPFGRLLNVLAHET